MPGEAFAFLVPGDFQLGFQFFWMVGYEVGAQFTRSASKVFYRSGWTAVVVGSGAVKAV